MIHDALALAKEIEAVRQRRLTIFSPGLFDEHSWDFLLLLFIAGEEGRDVRRKDVMNAVVGSDSVLDRWLKVLENDGAIKIEPGPEGRVSLSSEGKRKMFESLTSGRSDNKVPQTAIS